MITVGVVHGVEVKVGRGTKIILWSHRLPLVLLLVLVSQQHVNKAVLGLGLATWVVSGAVRIFGS